MENTTTTVQPAVTPSQVTVPVAPISMKVERSQTVGKIMKQLAAAQASIRNAVKSAENAFGKYKYATLEDILNACKDALSAQGVFFTQMPGSVVFSADNTSASVSLRTDIYYEDEFISHEFSVPVKITQKDRSSAPQVTVQDHGASITYARKYALSSIFGIAQSDDDGQSQQPTNSTRGRKPIISTPKPPVVEKIGQHEIAALQSMIGQTETNLEKFLNFYNINDLSELPKIELDQAMDMLQKKLLQQAEIARAAFAKKQKEEKAAAEQKDSAPSEEKK